MKRSSALTRFAGSLVALALLVPACGDTGGSSSDDEPESADSSPATTEPTTDPAVERRQLVAEAERIVLAELPDIPLWEGTKAKGTYVSETEVCVDRTYGPGGGIGVGPGGNAGYVVVTFPDGTPGEPQSGKCANRPEAEPDPEPVDVPDELEDEEGLVTRDDLGDEWPLTVPYGVLSCDQDEAGGYEILIITFMDPSGNKYALNGSAQSHTELPDIDRIWADDPDIEGLKIAIGPLIDRGLELC